MSALLKLNLHPLSWQSSKPVLTWENIHELARVHCKHDVKTPAYLQILVELSWLSILLLELRLHLFHNAEERTKTVHI